MSNDQILAALIAAPFLAIGLVFLTFELVEIIWRALPRE